MFGRLSQQRLCHKRGEQRFRSKNFSLIYRHSLVRCAIATYSGKNFLQGCQETDHQLLFIVAGRWWAMSRRGPMTLVNNISRSTH